MEVPLEKKLTSALERLAQAQRVLLWQTAEPLGLSPIQALILLHLHLREPSTRRVGVLAQYFDLTPATISDAVRALVAKGLLIRHPGRDRRTHTLELTPAGLECVDKLKDWDYPIQHALRALQTTQKEALYDLLLALLARLVEDSVITVVRMCLLCRHLHSQDGKYHCTLLQKPLLAPQLRVDCPEFSPGAQPDGRC